MIFFVKQVWILATALLRPLRLYFCARWSKIGYFKSVFLVQKNAKIVPSIFAILCSLLNYNNL